MNWADLYKKFIDKALDGLSELYVQNVADQLLVNIREEVTSGKYITLGGTPVYGFFDTGKFAATWDSQPSIDDSIIVGSTSRKPDPKLVEYGHAPEDMRTLKDEDIAKWLVRKRIVRGRKKALEKARPIANFIRNNGLSPRPILRNALNRTKSQQRLINKKTMQDLLSSA